MVKCSQRSMSKCGLLSLLPFVGVKWATHGGAKTVH
jgi:hypothetical protein